MEEKDFELLQTLADSRNITKAADKLYITQSTLSKRIRSIERELGIELRLRSHQGIRFTPLRGGGSGPQPCGGAGNGTDAQKAGVWIPSLSAWRW